jgi:hypothetical protein
MLEKMKDNASNNNATESNNKDNSAVSYDSITNINKEMQNNK